MTNNYVRGGLCYREAASINLRAWSATQ